MLALALYIHKYYGAEKQNVFETKYFDPKIVFKRQVEIVGINFEKRKLEDKKEQVYFQTRNNKDRNNI